MAKPGRYSKNMVARSHSPLTCTRVLAMLLILSVALLVLLALGIVSLPINNETPNGLPDHKSIKFQTSTNLRSDGLDSIEPWIEILSWEPRAFLYHNFLSKEECDYLISLAKPSMKTSTVVDSTTGQRKDSRVRTSSGTFLARGQDKFIRNIEKRIADFTFIPVAKKHNGACCTFEFFTTENGEGLQVLHYEVGQKYEPHFDYFLDEFNTRNGGQRIATMLMYLSDVEKGGETVFPSSVVNISSVLWWDELSDCAKSGISVRPRMGDALLFWSMKPDASLDPKSLHAGCPVIEGNKWSATKWMRLHEYKV